MGEESAVCMRVRCKEWGRSPHRGDQVDTIISEGQSMPGCHRAPTDTRHIRSSAETSVTFMNDCQWVKEVTDKGSDHYHCQRGPHSPLSRLKIISSSDLSSCGVWAWAAGGAAALVCCLYAGQDSLPITSLHYITWHVRYGQCWWAW